MPFPVRSFIGPRTKTGLYARGPISSLGHCHFRYGHSLGPVPKMGSMHVVPFPVRGSASSGTVIHWAPYQNWALYGLSHFRYGALPVPVRSFTGPHTETGLYMRGPFSGTGLCQFRYGHSLVPVPKLDSMPGGYARRWVCGFVGLWLVCAHFERHNDPITNLTFM
jgi:hypothetical protein